MITRVTIDKSNTKKSLRENVKIDEYLIFFHKIDIYGKSVLPTADSFC